MHYLIHMLIGGGGLSHLKAAVSMVMSSYKVMRALPCLFLKTALHPYDLALHPYDLALHPYDLANKPVMLLPFDILLANL